MLIQVPGRAGSTYFLGTNLAHGFVPRD